MAVDFAAINAAALESLPSLVAAWLPGGTMHGHEYRIGDLSGAPGDSLSINTSTGVWRDFAAGQGGSDPISLYAAIHGTKQGAAARALARELGMDVPQGQSQNRKRWTPQPQAPPDAPAPPDEKQARVGDSWQTWRVSRRWAYTGPDGALLGYVCRFDHADGSKDVLPVAWCEADDGQQAWRWLSFPRPRPLYNLPSLSLQGVVVVVEGEKAADAAAALLPGRPVVTWPGGGKAVKYADWSALAGRKVLIWPDADRPGLETAADLAAILQGQGCTVRIVQPEQDRPDGWDAADAQAEGWGPADTQAWLKARAGAPADLVVPPAPPQSASHTAQVDIEDAPPHDDEPPPPAPLEEPDLDRAPFTPLGYDHGLFYYLSHEARQVVPLPPSAHARQGLLQLAPVGWWETYFPGSKGGVSWDMAATYLFRTCYQRGVYDPSRLRGRGAWWDDGSSVLHLGDRLLVDGQAVPIDKVQSRYVYEAGSPMDWGQAEPASKEEAADFLDLCARLPFERDIYGTLLAGWCAVAPLCGAMPWRAHILLTGARGSGKSWTLEHIVRPMIGPMALFIQGESTEAGARQHMGGDARPILHDEIDPDDPRAEKRAQGMLGLARQASTEEGGVVLKGSAGGQAVHYQIRSMFCFASITPVIKRAADASRITVLSFQTPVGGDPEAREVAQQRFAALQERRLEVMTGERIDRLHARMVRMLPVIRANAETFAAAAAKVVGTRRFGDQIGTLLAGAYALTRDGYVSLEGACKWLESQDWSEQTEQQDQRDEEMCLQRIVERRVRLQNGKGTVDRTLGELIDLAWSRGEDTISWSDAAAELRRHGLKVEGRSLAISNNASGLASALEGTPWSVGWAALLKRIPGAAPSRNGMRFAPGSPVQRAVMIPVERVLGEDCWQRIPDEGG